jgi:hypothetical protein
LTTALRQQTGWLLAAPITVDGGQQSAPPSAADIPVIADVVELLLLALVPPGLPARAHVTVLTYQAPADRAGVPAGAPAGSANPSSGWPRRWARPACDPTSARSPGACRSLYGEGKAETAASMSAPLQKRQG